MREALVTLNVVHARDLELQTRIACDDERLGQAIVRYDRSTGDGLQRDVQAQGSCLRHCRVLLPNRMPLSWMPDAALLLESC